MVLEGLSGAFFTIICDLPVNSSKIINSPVKSSDIIVTLILLTFVSNSSVLLGLNLKYKHINGRYKTNNQYR